VEHDPFIYLPRINPTGVHWVQISLVEINNKYDVIPAKKNKRKKDYSFTAVCEYETLLMDPDEEQTLL
jgi:hypothetical protein